MKHLLPLLLGFLLAQGSHGQTLAPLSIEQQKFNERLLVQLQQQQLKGLQLATDAPYVFLGRPLTSESYQDKMGRYYISTVYQVVEVLRGAATIQPGTITVNKVSVYPEGQHLIPPKPGYEKVLQPQMGEMTEWGIYFCTRSTLVANPNPYITSNRVALALYAPYSCLQPVTGQAMTLDGCREVTYIEGLDYSFTSEKEMNEFLQKIPNLHPLAKPIKEYPRLSFVDERPGWKAYRRAHPVAPKTENPRY